MSQQTALQQIHPTAVVDPKAELASGVVIGPGAVVGPEVVIGENTPGSVPMPCWMVG